jgi:hypothetical protein
LFVQPQKWRNIMQIPGNIFGGGGDTTGGIGMGTEAGAKTAARAGRYGDTLADTFDKELSGLEKTAEAKAANKISQDIAGLI